MDQALLLGITLAAGVGVVATLVILRNQRQAEDQKESPFAASTEGETICPKCGMGSLWTDDRCISCGAKLPG